MTDESVNPAQLKHSRRVLSLIFGIPFGVILLSTVLYFLVDTKVVDLGTVNKGTLVAPPLPFYEMPLFNLGGSTDGTSFEYAQLEPKWGFVVFGDRNCAGSCEKMLYIARQSNIALAKKMNRVRMIYVSTEGAISAELQTLFDEQYKDITVVAADEQALGSFFAESGTEPLQPNTFFITDPRGWLMMYYQVDNVDQTTLNALGKDVLRDMKRLIK